VVTSRAALAAPAAVAPADRSAYCGTTAKGQEEPDGRGGDGDQAQQQRAGDERAGRGGHGRSGRHGDTMLWTIGRLMESRLAAHRSSAADADVVGS
jgi:hypothetical protein